MLESGQHLRILLPHSCQKFLHMVYLIQKYNGMGVVSMERIKRLNRYQQGILLLLLVMALVFAVIYSVFSSLFTCSFCEDSFSFFWEWHISFIAHPPQPQEQEVFPCFLSIINLITNAKTIPTITISAIIVGKSIFVSPFKLFSLYSLFIFEYSQD